MKILIVGAGGYIGRRILPVLCEAGHEVIALVRDPKRITIPERAQPQVALVQGDLLDRPTLDRIPSDVSAAYYLAHSMRQDRRRFAELEQKGASNLADWAPGTELRQIVYLSGLCNDPHLSPHFASRRRVEKILSSGPVPTTILRAGIIIGAGSASFEIIRDLVEKLPVMVAPRWVDSRCQPIRIFDVVDYLVGVLDRADCQSQIFDIGGPNILTYKEMLLGLANIRRFKRLILTVPVLTPRLSSYWLIFVTATNFSLARALIDSLKNDAVCADNRIRELIPLHLQSYERAVRCAFSRIEEHLILSSWKDAMNASALNSDLSTYVAVPRHGCQTDRKVLPLTRSLEEALDEIWCIGGGRGWYTMDWAWLIRGKVDKLFGGVGLRRGRTHPGRLEPGDALDFWRVLLADKQRRRLLLYAEMKLPGEAWLEFKIVETGGQFELHQTATFRPSGLFGRLYWYSMLPFHWWIFRHLARRLAHGKS